MNVIKFYSKNIAEGVVSVSIAFALCVIMLSSIGYDLELHCFNVAQILNGEYPLLAQYNETMPLKYHYGFDFVVAILMKLTGLDYPYVVSILLVIGSLLCVCVLTIYLHRRAKSLFAYASTMVGFFFSGCIFGFPFKDYFPEIGNVNQITFWSDINQSSWLFTLPLLLILIALFSKVAYMSLNDTLRISVILLFLGILAPIYSATSIALIGIALGTLVCTAILQKRMFIAVWPICIGILLLVIWKIFSMGLFVADERYEGPSLSTIFRVFDIKRVLSLFCYYVYVQPLAFVAYVFCIVYVVRNWGNLCQHTLDKNLMIMLILVCYPLPFVLYIDNIITWDNFCKFNELGIYSGLVFLVFFFNEIRHHVWLKILSIFLIAVVVQGSFWRFYTEVKTRNLFREHKKFQSQLSNKHELDMFLNSLPKRDVTFLVVSNAYPMEYRWDVRTRDFVFMFDMADSFKTISWKHGIRTLNYYDLNHQVKESNEKIWIDAMNGINRGDVKALKTLHPSYIICNLSETPDYVHYLVLKNILKVVACSCKEGWIIYEYVDILTK